MKLRGVIIGLITVLFAANAPATTLKLSPDIDLLVLDGHKIFGLLLKGADGLELERGEHQLLFRIERTIKNQTPTATNWVSAPQIVTFTTQAQSVTITLPALQTLRNSRHFDKNPRFVLLDEHDAEVASKRDRLQTEAQGDLEQAMVLYNLDHKIASVPRFAQPLRRTAMAAGQMPEIAFSQHPTERMLRLLYQQVDSATRQRFVLLMKALHTS